MNVYTHTFRDYGGPLYGVDDKEGALRFFEEVWLKHWVRAVLECASEESKLRTRRKARDRGGGARATRRHAAPSGFGARACGGGNCGREKQEAHTMANKTTNVALRVPAPRLEAQEVQKAHHVRRVASIGSGSPRKRRHEGGAADAAEVEARLGQARPRRCRVSDDSNDANSSKNDDNDSNANNTDNIIRILIPI